jgi:hypothetical protein
VKTSIETQIEDWLRMSDHGGRGRVRVGVRASEPAIVTRASLTPGARLDLAGLIAVHAQSRWSRLLVGDGRVTPFPVPRVPGSADERVKPE